MFEVERATWEISCRNCDRTKPGEVIPESPPNGFLISRAVPSHPSHSSRSLPLALQLGIRIMSASMVTLTKEFSITRPVTLLIFDPK